MPAFKAKVALAATRGDKTLAEFGQHYDVHPKQIQDWKKRLMAEAQRLFENGTAHGTGESEAKLHELHAKIGELTMERDLLARALGPAR